MTRTRIAAIIFREGELVLLKGKNYSELWTPGGKLESGETDLECLRRELKEEIQVELISAKFFKEYKGFSHYDKSSPLIQRVYLVTIKGVPRPSSEIESVVLLSKNDFKLKKYDLITDIEKKMIPDLIKLELW